MKHKHRALLGLIGREFKECDRLERKVRKLERQVGFFRRKGQRERKLRASAALRLLDGAGGAVTETRGTEGPGPAATEGPGDRPGRTGGTWLFEGEDEEGLTVAGARSLSQQSVAQPPLTLHESLSPIIEVKPISSDAKPSGGTLAAPASPSFGDHAVSYAFPGLSVPARAEDYALTMASDRAGEPTRLFADDAAAAAAAAAAEGPDFSSPPPAKRHKASPLALGSAAGSTTGSAHKKKRRLVPKAVSARPCPLPLPSLLPSSLEDDPGHALPKEPLREPPKNGIGGALGLGRPTAAAAAPKVPPAGPIRVFREVVRGKAERQDMVGCLCPHCKKYTELMLQDDPAYGANRAQRYSRHRHHQAPMETPADFFDVGSEVWKRGDEKMDSNKVKE
jgi:hypothetical protein